MKSPNLRPSCCMPRPKMVRNSWTLNGGLQYILTRGLLQKKKKTNDNNECKKKKSPNVMDTLSAHI